MGDWSPKIGHCESIDLLAKFIKKLLFLAKTIINISGLECEAISSIENGILTCTDENFLGSNYYYNIQSVVVNSISI